MSNPTELDVPGVPDWMQEDTEINKNPTSRTTSTNNDEALPDWAKPTNTTSTPTGNKTSTAPLEIVPANTSTKDNKNNNASGSAFDAASNKTWGQYFSESFSRDGRLLAVTLVIVICMNIPFIKWALYPFTIFSTWIHELCHGLSSLMAGGTISKLLVYPDTSGLAYTAVPPNRVGFVSSAGYQGTAVIGCLLLIFRRTKRGPRSGTMALAVTMIITVILWIRNAFGICFIGLIGILLAVAAWKLPSTHIRNLYICLAVTCSLNAITSVQNLFGSNHVVNGQSTSTDAQSMADARGGSAAMWATVWLLLALFLTVAGILFAIPGPDEVADFTCCGVCQDLGCFKVCNYPGLRLQRRFRGTSSDKNDATTPTCTIPRPNHRDLGV